MCLVIEECIDVDVNDEGDKWNESTKDGMIVRMRIAALVMPTTIVFLW